MIKDSAERDIFRTITYNLVNLTGLSLKQCRRIALSMLERDKNEINLLVKNISSEILKFHICNRCNGFVFDVQECFFCSPRYRDQSKLMFVENSINLDILSKVKDYEGIIYNLRGNLISPIRGMFTDDLPVESINKLINSLKSLKEVIFAFDQNFEIETTIFFIKNLIKKSHEGCVFYKLAQGIPIGLDIENVGLQAVEDAIKFKQKI